ncbi:MAG: hypothetical protein AAGA48_26590 [Myxococcota bacterium]
MKHSMAVLAVLSLTGCEFDLFAPSVSLRVEPAVVPVGISNLEVTDDDRRQDFREVVDVEDFGDFVVRDWSSNDERVFVEIDVFDDAFGTQELVIRLEDDEVLRTTFAVQ